MHTCETCGKEWPEAYCPECGHTIRQGARPTEPPPIPPRIIKPGPPPLPPSRTRHTLNFPDWIAKEHHGEFGEKTCWRLEITPPPEQLILRSWRVPTGREPYSWSLSVSLRDLDPQSITIEQPNEEGDLYHLRANCVLYKDGITEKRDYDASFLRKGVEMHFPISRNISDVQLARKSFQAFLKDRGARSPVMKAAAIEDLLAPLRKAIEPARWTIKWVKDNLPSFKQMVEIDTRKMLLIRKMERLKAVRFYKFPLRLGFLTTLRTLGELAKLWRLWKKLFPDVEQRTFELLSLDTTKTDVRPVFDPPNVWKTTLYSVEQLETTSVSTGDSMWYIDLFFPAQEEANQFAKVCASSVQQIRDRLYKLHQESL